MSLDRATLQAMVLVAWCAFMTWLWATGETLRYLGPRTQWLVPFGAITLGVAAAAAVHAARRDQRRERMSSRETAGLIALVVPIAAAMLLANAQLGAQAASKKLTSRGIDASALADLAAAGSGPVDFLQLSVAQKDHDFAKKNGLRPGKRVRLLGFVSRTAVGGGFQLSRFYITCCVADSIPIGATVLPAPTGHTAIRKDRWLEVTGSLVARNGGLVVRADSVKGVTAPDRPYLSVAR